DEVRHRAAGDQYGCFLARALGGHRLEPPHRGVFAEDVVAERRFRDRAAHLIGGKGDGVGAKVDDVRGHAPRCQSVWKPSPPRIAETSTSRSSSMISANAASHCAAVSP